MDCEAGAGGGRCCRDVRHLPSGMDHSGVDPDELTEVRAELEAFVDDVLASLPRSDQRAKGNLYLRGLMLDGRRKSMQPMGTRLGVDYQQLQQFVSSSPWKVEPVQRVLVRRALELISPDAWVVDDTGFKKDGASSPWSELVDGRVCRTGLAVRVFQSSYTPFRALGTFGTVWVHPGPREWGGIGAATSHCLAVGCQRTTPSGKVCPPRSGIGLKHCSDPMGVGRTC